MKITSRHLTTSSLVFRSNLRLIPLLLLLFLGYTRGMPHVLRFGKDLLTACTRHRRLARAECLITPRSLLSGENDVRDEIEIGARALPRSLVFLRRASLESRKQLTDT